MLTASARLPSLLLVPFLLLLLLLPESADAHGYLTCPKPRQYRDTKIAVWTRWMGLTVPGDASYALGEGNAPNLNAAIGGGAANQDVGADPSGHGLCGDIGSRRGYSAGGPYG